jgi:RNA polymerase sigma-70 factor (ECF subfamily)
VRLADQDRGQWDVALAAEAAGLLGQAMAMRRPGRYQVQAAIAAVHADAPVDRCRVTGPSAAPRRWLAVCP